MLSTTELEIQKKSTLAFINADFVSLQIERSMKTSNGAGGFITAPPTVVGDVRCRLVPQSDRVPEVSLSDGRLLRPRYVLVAEVGTDIQRNDIFSYNGDEWQIAAVHDKPEYAFKADVVCRA